MNIIITSSATSQVVPAEAVSDMCPGTWATAVLAQYFHGSSRSSDRSDSNDICRLGDTMKACQDRKITRTDLETLEMGVGNNRTSFCLENTAKKCKEKENPKAQMFDKLKKTGEL